MKSDEVIALEIALLAELAKLVLPVDDKALIAAQIDVLAYRLNRVQVCDGYMKGSTYEMFMAAAQASDWVHGLPLPSGAMLPYDHPPSMEWRDVVKYTDGAQGVDERARAALVLAHRAQSAGVRCHGDACAAGQLPCPTPRACGVEGGAL